MKNKQKKVIVLALASYFASVEVMAESNNLDSDKVNAQTQINSTAEAMVSQSDLNTLVQALPTNLQAYFKTIGQYIHSTQFQSIDASLNNQSNLKIYQKISELNELSPRQQASLIAWSAGQTNSANVLLTITALSESLTVVNELPASLTYKQSNLQKMLVNQVIAQKNTLLTAENIQQIGTTIQFLSQKMAMNFLPGMHLQGHLGRSDFGQPVKQNPHIAQTYYQNNPELGFSINGKVQTWNNVIGDLIKLIAENPQAQQNIKNLFYQPSSEQENITLSTSKVTLADVLFNIQGLGLSKATEGALQEKLITLIQTQASNSDLANMIYGYNQAINALSQENPSSIKSSVWNTLLTNQANLLLSQPGNGAQLARVFTAHQSLLGMEQELSAKQNAVLNNWIATQASTNLSMVTVISNLNKAWQALSKKSQVNTSTLANTLYNVFEQNKNSAALGEILQKFPTRYNAINHLLLSLPSITKKEGAELRTLITGAEVNFDIASSSNSKTSDTVIGALGNAITTIYNLPKVFDKQKSALQAMMINQVMNNSNSSKLPQIITQLTSTIELIGQRQSQLDKISLTYGFGPWSGEAITAGVNYGAPLPKYTTQKNYKKLFDDWFARFSAITEWLNEDGAYDMANPTVKQQAEVTNYYTKAFKAQMYLQITQTLAYKKNGKQQTWNDVMQKLMTLVLNNPQDQGNIAKLFYHHPAYFSGNVWDGYTYVPIGASDHEVFNDFFKSTQVNAEPANALYNIQYGNIPDQNKAPLQEMVMNLITSHVSDPNLNQIVDGFNQAINAISLAQRPNTMPLAAWQNLQQQQIQLLLENPTQGSNLSTAFNAQASVLSSIKLSTLSISQAQLQKDFDALIKNNITSSQLGTLVSQFGDIIKELQPYDTGVNKPFVNKIFSTLSANQKNSSFAGLLGLLTAKTSNAISAISQLLQSSSFSQPLSTTTTSGNLTDNFSISENPALRAALENYVLNNLGNAQLSSQITQIMASSKTLASLQASATPLQKILLKHFYPLLTANLGSAQNLTAGLSALLPLTKLVSSQISVSYPGKAQTGTLAGFASELQAQTQSTLGSGLLESGFKLLASEMNNPNMSSLLKSYNTSIADIFSLQKKYAQVSNISIDEGSNSDVSKITKDLWNNILSGILQITSNAPSLAAKIAQSAEQLPTILNKAQSSLSILVKNKIISAETAATIPNTIITYVTDQAALNKNPAQTLEDLTTALNHVAMFAKTTEIINANPMAYDASMNVQFGKIFASLRFTQLTESTDPGSPDNFADYVNPTGVSFVTWGKQLSQFMNLMTSNPNNANNIETAIVKIPALYKQFNSDSNKTDSVSMKQFSSAVMALISKEQANPDVSTSLTGLQTALATLQTARNSQSYDWKNMPKIPVSEQQNGTTVLIGQSAWQSILNISLQNIIKNPENASNIVNATLKIPTVLNTTTLINDGLSAEQAQLLQTNVVSLLNADAASPLVSQTIENIGNAVKKIKTLDLTGLNLTPAAIINRMVNQPSQMQNILSALTTLQTTNKTIMGLSQATGITLSQKASLLAAASNLFSNSSDSNNFAASLTNFNAALQTINAQATSNSAIALQEINDGTLWQNIINSAVTDLSSSPSNSQGISEAFSELLTSATQTAQALQSNEQGTFIPSDWLSFLTATLKNNMNNPNIAQVFKYLLNEVNTVNNTLVTNPILTDGNANSLWSFLTLNRSKISIPRFLQTMDNAVAQTNQLASMAQKNQLNAALFTFAEVNQDSRNINGLMVSFKTLIKTLVAQPNNTQLWQAFQTVNETLSSQPISITEMQGLTNLLTTNADNSHLNEIINSIVNYVNPVNQITSMQYAALNHLLSVTPESTVPSLMSFLNVGALFSINNLVQQVAVLNQVTSSSVQSDISNFESTYLPYMFPSNTVAKITAYLNKPENAANAPNVMRDLLVTYLTKTLYPIAQKGNERAVVAMQSLNATFLALKGTGFGMNYGNLQGIYGTMSDPNLGLPASDIENLKLMMNLTGINAERQADPSWSISDACGKNTNPQTCNLTFSSQLAFSQPFTNTQIQLTAMEAMYNSQPEQLYQHLLETKGLPNNVLPVIRWAIDNKKITANQVPLLLGALSYYKTIHAAQVSGALGKANIEIESNPTVVANYQSFLSVLGARYVAAQKNTTLQAEFSASGDAIFNNDILSNQPFQFIGINDGGNSRGFYDKDLESFDASYFSDNVVYAKQYLSTGQQDYLNNNAIKELLIAELTPMYKCPTGDAGINCGIKRSFQEIGDAFVNTFKGDSVADIFKDIGLGMAMFVASPALIPLAVGGTAIVGSIVAVDSFQAVLANYSSLKDESEVFNSFLSMVFPPAMVLGTMKAYAQGCQISEGVSCMKNFALAMTVGTAQSIAAPFNTNNNLSTPERVAGGILSFINVAGMGDMLGEIAELTSADKVTLLNNLSEKIGGVNVDLPDTVTGASLNLFEQLSEKMAKLEDKDFDSISNKQALFFQEQCEMIKSRLTSELKENNLDLAKTDQATDPSKRKLLEDYKVRYENIIKNTDSFLTKLQADKTLPVDNGKTVNTKPENDSVTVGDQKIVNSASKLSRSEMSNEIESNSSNAQQGG
jgi:hypothetical protein